jgi:hypothetical protein
MLLNKQSFQISLLASAIALTGCGGSSSSTPADSGPGTGRAGAAFSGLTISAKGGESTLGEGGNGGNVGIYKTNSATNLNIVKTGNIDTTYTLPTQTPEFGNNPVTISSPQTIILVDDSVLPAAGTLYMLPSEYRLFKSTGNKLVGDESHEVTGLTIDADVELFLPANNGSSTTYLYFNNDVQNNGTISTVNGERSTRIDLNLTAAAYYGTGDINLKGDIDNYNRQSGGDLTIYAYTIMHSGLFNTSGANYDNERPGNGGGSAGTIQLIADVFIENTGELRANGGNSDSYAGTNGADINLYAAAIINTGLINSNSGSGNSQNYSYNDSDIYLSASRSILNTGSISSKGADADENGNAGKGGDIEFYLDENEMIAFDQSIINTGDLIVDGGSITGVSTGYAGNGGSIEIYTEEPDEETNGPVKFEISGNLSANGGSTTEEYSNAGNGGEISIANYDNPSSSAETFIIGYDEINTSGGNGVDAGYAGEINMIFEDYRDERGGYHMPTVSGSIYNNVNLTANGGNTTAEAQEAGDDPIYGSGERGGYVALYANNYSAYLQPGAINVINEGIISVNGGNSYNDSYKSNAEGGGVDITASHRVEITQPINLNGGSDLHPAATGESDEHSGSNAGEIMITSQYEETTINTDISANGGQGDLQGGNGGLLYVMSKLAVSLNGTVNLNGGNTAADDADSFETEGGDAGFVNIVSESMDSQVLATITASAGTGDVAGDEKVVIVDADCLSNNCNFNSGPR